jgi:uncharacterized protein DUF4760
MSKRRSQLAIAFIAVFTVGGIIWEIGRSGEFSSVRIAALVVAAATMVYATLTFELVRATERSVEAIRETARIDRTVDLMTRWNDPALTESRRRARELLESDEASRVGGQEDSLIEFCNLLMTIALVVETGTGDEPLLRQSFREVVATYYPKLQPWIEGRRKYVGRPNLYEELGRLNERWLGTD